MAAVAPVVCPDLASPVLDAALQQVLEHYPGEWRGARLEFLQSAGGFSGALFWKITLGDRAYCLRRWPPEHPAPQRLAFIHAVLQHVRQQGFRLAISPLPQEVTGNRRQAIELAGRGARPSPAPLAPQTIVAAHGHLWELTPWVRGAADFALHPSPARLESALRALAGFHLAAASFPGIRPGEPRSVRDRIDRIEKLQSGGLARLGRSLDAAAWPELARLGRRLCALFPLAAPPIYRALQGAARSLPRQPCIRDIWHDHVYFEGDQVSGMIDFGAMDVDHVATDVARLLGSLAADDRLLWSAGLAAYEQLRPLNPLERQLVTTLDAGFVLLAGLNWLEWVFCQGRKFTGQESTIVARVEQIVTRLEKRLEA
jgi:homoserine kinase type II